MTKKRERNRELEPRALTNPGPRSLALSFGWTSEALVTILRESKMMKSKARVGR
jgi:hypothetical protein